MDEGTKLIIVFQDAAHPIARGDRTTNNAMVVAEPFFAPPSKLQIGRKRGRGRMRRGQLAASLEWRERKKAPHCQRLRSVPPSFPLCKKGASERSAYLLLSTPLMTSLALWQSLEREGSRPARLNGPFVCLTSSDVASSFASCLNQFEERRSDAVQKWRVR